MSKICHYCLKSIFSLKCTNQKSDPSCWLRLTLSKIHLVFKIKFHPNLIVLAPEPALILLRDIFCIKLHFNLKISPNVMNKKIRYLSSSIYEKIPRSVWLSGYQCGPIWACDRSFLSNRMLTTRRFTFQNRLSLQIRFFINICNFYQIIHNSRLKRCVSEDSKRLYLALLGWLRRWILPYPGRHSAHFVSISLKTLSPWNNDLDANRHPENFQQRSPLTM